MAFGNVNCPGCDRSTPNWDIAFETKLCSECHGRYYSDASKIITYIDDEQFIFTMKIEDFTKALHNMWSRAKGEISQEEFETERKKIRQKAIDDYTAQIREGRRPKTEKEITEDRKNHPERYQQAII